jgi:hypothetical protein
MMPDVPAETLDRLLAGELPDSEERRIAQLALADPELFELLTAAGIVKSAVVADEDFAQTSILHADHERVPPGSNHPTAVRGSAWTSRPRVLAMAALATAAIIVLAIAFGSSRSARRPAAIKSAADAPRVDAAIPPPLLLTARFDAARQPAFRTDAGTSRLPRQTGTIVSVRDGEVDVDLGSLDGLKRGVELRAVHGQGDARAGGRVTITVVFRERSRGRLGGGANVQAGDRVDVAPTAHVAAILEQATARRAAGDLAAARKLAQLAVSRSSAAEVAADVRRRSLDQLGVLQHEAGDLDGAVRLFAAAADDFDAAPAAEPAERADVLNELGAMRIEQRDYAAAERTLQSALSFATGAAKVRVTNNLGAIAALRGDMAAADRLYREARSLAGDSADLAADRQAIEKNLGGLKTSR